MSDTWAGADGSPGLPRPSTGADARLHRRGRRSQSTGCRAACLQTSAKIAGPPLPRQRRDGPRVRSAGEGFLQDPERDREDPADEQDQADVAHPLAEELALVGIHRYEPSAAAGGAAAGAASSSGSFFFTRTSVSSIFFWTEAGAIATTSL